MYKRKLAIVAILAATVLLLVTTSSLVIGCVLVVKTVATHKIKSSNIGGSIANTSTTTATLDTSTHKDSKNLSPLQVFADTR